MERIKYVKYDEFSYDNLLNHYAFYIRVLSAARKSGRKKFIEKSMQTVYNVRYDMLYVIEEERQDGNNSNRDN